MIKAKVIPWGRGHDLDDDIGTWHQFFAVPGFSQVLRPQAWSGPGSQHGLPGYNKGHLISPRKPDRQFPVSTLHHVHVHSHTHGLPTPTPQVHPRLPTQMLTTTHIPMHAGSPPSVHTPCLGTVYTRPVSTHLTHAFYPGYSMGTQAWLRPWVPQALDFCLWTAAVLAFLLLPSQNFQDPR